MIKNKLMLLGLSMTLLLSLAGCGSEKPLDQVDEVKETETEKEQEQNKEEKYITFNSLTVEGKKVNDSIFEDAELTLVNIFATWCTPCVKEIPYLNELDNEIEGFNVVGIVYDAYDKETNTVLDDILDVAKEIKEKTGAEYPFIIPDQDFINSTTKNAAAIFPVSFFVDKDGKIVKGPVGGAHTKEEWQQMIEDLM